MGHVETHFEGDETRVGHVETHFGSCGVVSHGEVVKRDSREQSCLLVTGEKFLDVFKDELPRKHSSRDSFIDQKRRRPTTTRYGRSVNRQPCRLKIGGP